MINRYFYKASIKEFLNSSFDKVFGQISLNDEGDSVAEQKSAWSEEIEDMQQTLTPWRNEDAEIIFEYSIIFDVSLINSLLLLTSSLFSSTNIL